MRRYRGIALTDGVNRKDHYLPLKTILNAYGREWVDGVPSNLSHDATRPIGWAYIDGVYLEPGKAYATNEIYIPENEEEQKLVSYKEQTQLIAHYMHDNQKGLNELASLLGDKLSDKKMIVPVEAAAYWDRNIVLKVFPELNDKLDKDGLIHLSELESVEQVEFQGLSTMPGIFKRGKFLLFAHSYYRRNCSYLNTLNDAFLSRYQKLKDMDNADGTPETLGKGQDSIKIALDFDLIGLAGTEQASVEYQYWYGPKYDDDLANIQEGVTRHKNDHYDEVFNNISDTDFWWYVQDGKHTFECEEINTRENLLAIGRQGKRSKRDFWL